MAFIKKSKEMVRAMLSDKQVRNLKAIGKKILTKKQINYINRKLGRNPKNRKKVMPLEEFSIITAVYNGEKYLDDYFSSILIANKEYISQLEVIIVDDGSIDGTKIKIESWKSKYPDIITYVYQENQGQAKARQTGLAYATKKWVNFMDSDDFIDKKYFSEVSEAMNHEPNQNIFATRWIYYMEDRKRIADTHPLAYRYNFKGKYKKVNLEKNPDHFHFSINAVFIKREIIEKYNMVMPEVKPYFEDAFFLFQYILNSETTEITFCKNAIYYYRKRIEKTSTIDLSKNKIERYTTLLNDAYVNLLKEYNDKLGKIPNFLQRAIIYDLSWNLKEHKNLNVILSESEIEYREEKIQEIFSYIDYENVADSWKYLWKLYQIGINYRYYGGKEFVKAAAYYFYEDNNDYIIQLVSYEDKWLFNFGGIEHALNQFEYTMKSEDFENGIFGYRYFVKLPKNIICDINEMMLSFEGEILTISQISNNFEEFTFSSDSMMLFYDRECRADDNAEVFYEWLMKNKPEFTNIYFAISSDSEDYSRLQKKGFQLVDYGSKMFEIMYKSADLIVSSAFDKTIENYGGLRYPSFQSRAKFIFLQHGVALNDLNEWFSIKRYDKIVISSQFEKKQFMEKYTMFDSQILETGLPRHDKLVSKAENIILVAPTWRTEFKDMSLSEFKETGYYKTFFEILYEKKIVKLLKEKKYSVHVLLHPEVHKFRSAFLEHNLENVHFLDTNLTSYNEQYKKAKIMITDYSSAVLDFAYLKKQIIYFQKDYDTFFSTHLWDTLFSYEEDGLGPVVKTNNQLVKVILDSVDRNGLPEQKYFDRIDDFFLFSDGKNCQRIFEELTKL